MVVLCTLDRPLLATTLWGYVVLRATAEGNGLNRKAGQSWTTKASPSYEKGQARRWKSGPGPSRGRAARGRSGRWGGRSCEESRDEI